MHADPEKNLITLNVELPGVKKDDVKIDVHNGVLTVSGEHASSGERKEDGWVVRERRSGRFERAVRLPQGVRA